MGVDRRRVVGINAETITDVTSTDFPGHYSGEDHSWDTKIFKKNFSVKFHYSEPLNASFSLIGIDASIANAFRRILLAEVPTLAIEDVFVHNNTSIIQDEVLSHRLGLVPLKGSKEGLRWLKWLKKPTEEDPTVGQPSDYNTIVLKLNIECTLNEDMAKKGETDPKLLYNNSDVYTRSLEFHPAGRQVTIFSGAEGAIQPVNPNILLAKLRPGQVIDLEMHCVKGIGADHAKFSPVAPASYRLLPSITITSPILGKDAEKFARCFPRGVIGHELVTLEESSAPPRKDRNGREILTGLEGKVGVKKAVVKDPMRDTVSRECLRHPEFEGKVKLGRVRDHFIFSVESTGQFDSDELFLESVKVLRVKCERFKRSLRSMLR